MIHHVLFTTYHIIFVQAAGNFSVICTSYWSSLIAPLEMHPWHSFECQRCIDQNNLTWLLYNTGVKSTDYYDVYNWCTRLMYHYDRRCSGFWNQNNIALKCSISPTTTYVNNCIGLKSVLEWCMHMQKKFWIANTGYSALYTYHVHNPTGNT